MGRVRVKWCCDFGSGRLVRRSKWIASRKTYFSSMLVGLYSLPPDDGWPLHLAEYER